MPTGHDSIRERFDLGNLQKDGLGISAALANAPWRDNGTRDDRLERRMYHVKIYFMVFNRQKPASERNAAPLPNCNSG
jgi:hypothetical protein